MRILDCFFACSNLGLSTTNYTGGSTQNPCLNGHTAVVDQAVAATCTSSGLTQGKHCSVCSAIPVPQETVPALGHSITKTTRVRATLSTDGCAAHYECRRCSQCFTDSTGSRTVAKSAFTIYRPTTFKLSATSLTDTGKNRNPGVTVTDSQGNALVKDQDYSVTYPAESAREYEILLCLVCGYKDPGSLIRWLWGR